MAQFEITVDVFEACGYQTCRMEARDKAEALRLYREGRFEIVEEEIDVVRIGKVTIDDIDEVTDETEAREEREG